MLHWPKKISNCIHYMAKSQNSKWPIRKFQEILIRILLRQNIHIYAVYPKNLRINFLLCTSTDWVLNTYNVFWNFVQRFKRYRAEWERPSRPISMHTRSQFQLFNLKAEFPMQIVMLSRKNISNKDKIKMLHF